EAWSSGARVREVPYPTFEFLVEVRGDRAWASWPLYRRLADRLEKPEDVQNAFRYACTRVDQGVSEEQASLEALRDFVVTGRPAPTTAIGTENGTLRVGSTVVRIKKRL
ncbi:MAG: hypothetical protein AB1758_35885, partial [Candidatus Eremiobacterota bacterium]